MSSKVCHFGLFSRRKKEGGREREMSMLGFLRQWRSVAKDAFERATIVTKFLCLLHITDSYLVSTTPVYGPSMLPTLNLAGDIVLTEHVSHRVGKVGPGDLVVARSPEDPRKTVTKRIVGMEGDKITFLVDPRRSDAYRSVVVPKGHVWLQGDNLYMSNDSRHYGPVPYGLIKGKVFLRVWPPDSIGPLSQ